MSKERPAAKPGNRRVWPRIVGWTLVLASTTLAARQVRRFVMDDPRFIVQAEFAEAEDSAGFVIRGIRHASRVRVAQVFAEDFGRNILLLPTDARRRRMLAIDWVEDAKVARVWPNRIEVTIRERTPVAFVEVTRDARSARLARLALIDAEGVLLEKPAQGEFSFPVLTGVYEQQSEAERKQRVHRMTRFAGEIGPLVKDVSEIDVSSSDLKVTVKAGGRLLDLFIGNQNFEGRLNRFWRHYPEIRKRSPQATGFDLRLDDRITVRE